MDRLTRGDILAALEALAAAIDPALEPIEIAVVGGAAMVLLYDARATTKDVDAFAIIPETTARLRTAAAQVAEARQLPADWLNDAAKGYLHGLALGPVILERAGLRVRTVAVHQLLAMKLSAWRDDLDIDDARLLLSKLAGDRDAVWKLVEPYLVPGRELKARYAFDDLWEARDAAR